MVAVRLRILQTFEQHHARAAAEYGALGIGVEGARMTVRTGNGAFLVNIAASLWKRDGYPSRERHVGLVTPQRLAGLHYRHEGGGARGLDGQAGPA